MFIVLEVSFNSISHRPSNFLPLFSWFLVHKNHMAQKDWDGWVLNNLFNSINLENQVAS